MTMHVVLVHGLWQGGWCWDEVRDRMAGIPCTALDLPMRSLEADAAVLTEVLDGVDAPVVLVGHSYGGAVVTAAGAHPAVRELVYLAAFQLDSGESISRTLPERDIPATRLGAALHVDGDDVALDPVLGRGVLYNRTPADVAEAALARSAPVARALFRAVPQRFAWRERPSTYVVCAEDRCVHPDLQRAMAERADRVLEWDSDHCPQAGRPGDVADLLRDRASG